MIKLIIGNKKFKGIYRWDEMSLRKFIELSNIPMPEGYEALVLADGKYDHTRQDSVDHYVKVVTELTDKQLNEDFPNYYRKVVLCLSDVPEKDLTDEMANVVYEMYFRPFVVSLIYNAPVISFMGGLKDYTPEPVESFKIQGKRYYLPESITINGIDVPLAKEPIISYSEASDLFANVRLTKQANKLARFMAIYCRRKNEKYSDEIVLEREQLFMDLPMSTVWNVFFCIIKRVPAYLRTILLFGIRPGNLAEARESARLLLNTVHLD